MKQLNSFILIFFIVVLSFPAQAQNGKIKRGDKYYEWMAYPIAIRKYEKGLKKDRDLRAMERIADAYRQVGNTVSAEKWYAEVVKTTGAAPINMLHYGQVLKSNGKYMEARKWFAAYLQTGEAPKVAARFIESCDFAMEGRKDSARYTITAEPFNTKRSEFGPIITAEGMIFAAEKPGGCVRRLNLRNENFFYDLYTMKRTTKKKGYKLKRLKGKVNRKYHEGPAVLNRKQNMMYFTRSNFVADKKAKNGKNLSRLKIFSSSPSKGKWKNVEELPFNSEEYSCGHPALSKDGNTMYFSSNRPGGFGGTDLYMSRKEGDSWGTPRNLGSAINTEGDEEFPYMHAGGTLFFASTGLPGYGGFDIFSAKPSGAGWETPVNLGYPLNTSGDEFTMAWINNRPAGYFASDRDGDDDIYKFSRKMEIRGVIVDSRTAAP
ncbi:MAG TPA: hypothetical protein ENJ82_02100, partial [Bacteroidetes bacterium]|nr:hypothetical protein [Bacteroidota bacterium]